MVIMSSSYITIITMITMINGHLYHFDPSNVDHDCHQGASDSSEETVAVPMPCLDAPTPSGDLIWIMMALIIIMIFMMNQKKKIHRVVTDNKDLGFATSQEELAEMCPKLMDGLRCRHLLLFYQNYKPVSSNTEDSSLRNSQPVQTKSCSQQPSQPPNPLPPNSLKFVFLSCGLWNHSA